MKTKLIDCINTDHCPTREKGLRSEHNALGVVVEEGMTAKNIEWQCTGCGYKHLEVMPKVRCKKRSWPHYNDSLGMTLESESHEKHVVKENNLTAL